VRQLVSDIRHNGGLPSQVDAGAFRVGDNLALSPGAVVYRDEVCEILQYTPTTPRVRSRPIVMVPPQINKFYFMDLAPKRSFIEYAVSRGLPFFAISWRNPVADQGGWNLDTYAERVVTAFDVAAEITGSDSVNLLGMCAGGITASTVLSHLALRAPDRVNSASFGVTLLDFDVPAMVGMMNSRPLLAVAKKRSARSGVLDGQSLAAVFTWMRPNDLVWNYWVNNYLMGRRPPAFDILAWNADKTNLPSALHAQFLEIFAGNSLVHAGEISVLGTPVDLARITCDTYVTGGLTDHLTPWTGCYRATQLFSGPSTFVLGHSGHIQTMVNPPGNPKAHYFRRSPARSRPRGVAGEGGAASGELVGALGRMGAHPLRRGASRAYSAGKPAAQGPRPRPGTLRARGLSRPGMTRGPLSSPPWASRDHRMRFVESWHRRHRSGWRRPRSTTSRPPWTISP